MAKLHSRFIKDKRLQRFDLCCLNYDEYMMLKRLVQYANIAYTTFGYTKLPCGPFELCSIHCEVSADESNLKTLTKLAKIL